MSLAAYFEDVGNHNLLSREEEVELSKRVEKGDKSARDKLVSSNLRLAISLAKKYKNRGVDFEDLIQESNIGLLKAVDRFDWRRGYKFSTYACWWIRQSILKHINEQRTDVKLPSHLRRLAWTALEYERDYEKEFGEKPSEELLADAMGVSLKVLKRARGLRQGYVSLDDYVGAAGEGRKLAEIIPDDTLQDPDEAIDMKRMSAELRNALRSLTPREEAVLRMRFGLGPDDSDDEFLESVL